MATPQSAITLETCERLSEIYLALWQQLAAKSGENKWFEIQSPGEGLAQMIEQALTSSEVDPHSVLMADYRRTQELLTRSDAHLETIAFAEYLRDNGLRYAELADSLESPA